MQYIVIYTDMDYDLRRAEFDTLEAAQDYIENTDYPSYLIHGKELFIEDFT